MLLFPLCLRAQKNEYITSAGDTLRVGDKIKVGPGTLPDGGYKYLEGLITPGIGMTGQVMTVKAILQRGNRKIGYSYYAKLFPGAGIINYQAYIEYALKSGEIEIIH
jgi:hypothetical protein